MHIRNDWQTLAAAPRFVVFDTETTGLDHSHEELLEIGAVLVSGGALVGNLSLLIRPSKSIPAEAANVNGISDAMVATALTPTEALSCFEFFIGSYPLVAHNANFDIAFVQAALGYTLANSVYCTANMARKVLPRQERFGLNALCRRFGIENSQAHRALSDAEATAKVALALIAYGQNPPLMRHFCASGQNTYSIRETLKAFGFKWMADEKQWCISLTLEEIPEALTSDGEKGLRIYGIPCVEISASL